MRIDWQQRRITHHPDDADYPFVRSSDILHPELGPAVINTDTGEDVGKDIVWADDQTGEYKELLRDSNGAYILVNADGTPWDDEWGLKGKPCPEPASRIVKANLRFVFKGPRCTPETIGVAAERIEVGDMVYLDGNVFRVLR
jgi:hypothetical protein